MAVPSSSPSRSGAATGGAAREVPVLVALDRQAALPLGAQLAAALRRAALEGTVGPGDRLPSTRALARRLGVSRTVTAAAYDELLAEGWLTARVGAGTFVTARGPASGPPGPGARRPGPPADGPHAGRPGTGHHPPEEARDDAADDDPQLLDLRPGSPWVAGIDRAAWRRAWRRAADRPPTPRRSPAGAPEYRRCVAERLLHHRGLAVPEPERADGVLATAGTSAAIAELAVAVLHPGDRVAIEDPGYGRAVATLRAVGVVVVPVPVDDHGIDPWAVPDDVRAVYCSPAHQYPLGSRLPVSRRVELIERARRHGWLVVEDDYDGELRFDVAPPPALASLARDVVVHLGTTSKILSPSLGCGWMVAPAEVAERVLEHRRRTAVAPALPGQFMLVEFARTGDLGRHLRAVRRELAARRDRLVRRLQGHGVRVPGVDAGAHVVVPLQDAEQERAVLAGARQAGLLVDRLSRHYHGPSPHHGLVVGYTADDGGRLDAATETLCQLLT
ncbi:MAG TPA: PLP-dependent aminotransferase family protein [Kineosporiaceae bacterium]